MSATKTTTASCARPSAGLTSRANSPAVGASDSVCRDSVICSGHGRCNPGTGTSCSCEQGWESAPGIAFPGPFCNVSTTAVASNSNLSQTAIRILLTVGLPAFTGAVLLSAVGVLVLNYRRRMLKKSFKTIIEFPQPQLDVTAEVRDSNLLMVPDEDGWANFEVAALLLDLVRDASVRCQKPQQS